MKAIKSMTRLSCNDEKTLLKDINTDNYFFLTSNQLIPASEDEAKQFIKDICLPRFARLWPHDDFFSQFAKQCLYWFLKQWRGKILAFYYLLIFLQERFTMNKNRCYDDQSYEYDEDEYALVNYNLRIKNRQKNKKKDKFTDKKQKQIVYQKQ